MSQVQQILRHMQDIGPITPLEALDKYGCFRLAARIRDLRDDGHQIETTDVTVDSGKTVAQYSMKGTQ